MEHIADEWLERGIRSTFAIRPEVSGFRGTRNSSPTGLGWRFSIEHAMGEHTYSFKFDAFLVHKAYLGTLSIPPEDIQIDNMLPIQTDNMVCELPFGGWKKIGTWLVVDPARLATISFYVSQACPPGRMNWWGERVDNSILIAFPTTAPPQAPSPPQASTPSIPPPLPPGASLGDGVLIQSLDEGMGGMVQFILPYRVSGRHVMATRSVYGSPTLCKALQLDMPDFKQRFTADQHWSRNEYDYETDSDISDDEDENAREDLQQGESPAPPGTADTAKTLSVVDDLEVLSIRSGGNTSDVFVDWGDDAEGGSNASTRHPESAIVVKQHAHRTWKALLFYMYTGRITLKKLSSARDPLVPEVVNALACSPKSMYRIAEKANLDDLRALCLKAIAADLTEKNITSEVFSTFSSKYSEVLDLETDVLVKYMRDSESVCNLEVRRVMQDATSRPHCGKAISMIWGKIAK
ncbi:uncharacterized protein SCHCODRAFT_02511270 [Schizophyllum commune H4-8]|nr:uncharacterized protein SCHCODRAFT_02511270 [Schizophyllum commune H4-8]KAI5889713.1 hypothetical protein SCHCODRAFT_02511270 [Schizophyllum commune H4-8]